MRPAALPAVALLAVVLTACSVAHPYPPAGPGSPSPTGAPTVDGSDDPAAGTCPVGTPDCDDTAAVDLPVATGDDFVRGRASDLLGAAEADLPDDVRVGRRGDETFMLTEDYVVGRLTVELDRGGDAYVVSLVHAELAGGPETLAGVEAPSDDIT